jgi:hypothetical protein
MKKNKKKRYWKNLDKDNTTKQYIEKELKRMSKQKKVLAPVIETLSLKDRHS